MHWRFGHVLIQVIILGIHILASLDDPNNDTDTDFVANVITVRVCNIINQYHGDDQ